MCAFIATVATLAVPCAHDWPEERRLSFNRFSSTLFVAHAHTATRRNILLLHNVDGRAERARHIRRWKQSARIESDKKRANERPLCSKHIEAFRNNATYNEMSVAFLIDADVRCYLPLLNICERTHTEQQQQQLQMYECRRKLATEQKRSLHHHGHGGGANRQFASVTEQFEIGKVRAESYPTPSKQAKETEKEARSGI